VFFGFTIAVVPKRVSNFCVMGDVIVRTSCQILLGYKIKDNVFWDVPYEYMGDTIKVKGKSIPLQAWTDPIGFQEFEAPRFQDSRHMKAVSLSALHTGLLYPPGIIYGAHFC
jgi:hypothetical protein